MGTELGSQAGQGENLGAAIFTSPTPSVYLDLGTGAGKQPEGAIEAEWAHLEAVRAAAHLLPSERGGGCQSVRQPSLSGPPLTPPSHHHLLC